MHRRGPGLAFAIALARDAGEHAAQLHFHALVEAFEGGRVVRGQFRDLIFVAVQRMAGDLEAQQLFFALQFFLVGPVGGFGKRRLGDALPRAFRRRGRACPLSRSRQARCPASMAPSSGGQHLRARAFAANPWRRL